MAQELSNSVNIRALHSHPTRCCVAQIMKTEIENLLLLAESAKVDADLVWRDTRKHLFRWFGFAADRKRL